jgi:hypothetical protein
MVESSIKSTAYETEESILQEGTILDFVGITKNVKLMANFSGGTFDSLIINRECKACSESQKDQHV